MNIYDKLLALDENKLKRATKEIEIKRLTKKFGFPFKLKLTELDPELFNEISKSSIKFSNNGIKDIDTYKIQTRLVVEGTLEPSFKDAKLREHFHAATPIDLVNKLFNSSEITEIAGEISGLCGYGSQTDVDDEIKN